MAVVDGTESKSGKGPAESKAESGGKRMKTANEKTMETIYLLICRYFNLSQRRTLIAYLAAKDFFRPYNHKETPR